jgi:ribonuclease HI
MVKKLIIYTDGGARRNPGPAAIGVVICNEKNEIIKKFSKFIGRATNNQAEYQAVIYALEKAKQMKAEETNFYLDSELVVQQLNRKYKIKDKDLATLFIKIWNLSQNFKAINFFYIPREKNKEADRLVNQVLKRIKS